jgi:hypothetical protein
VGTPAGEAQTFEEEKTVRGICCPLVLLLGHMFRSVPVRVKPRSGEFASQRTRDSGFLRHERLSRSLWNEERISMHVLVRKHRTSEDGVVAPQA